mgnify:CR=1 FL=1
MRSVRCGHRACSKSSSPSASTRCREAVSRIAHCHNPNKFSAAAKRESLEGVLGGSFTLTLEGVDPEMLAFTPEMLQMTDRPELQAKTLDTTAFLDYWANDSSGDRLNTVFTGAVANGVRVSVTLSDPRVGMSARDDGAVTPSAGAVTFTATPLPGQEPPTSVITQPTLFIDDASICFLCGLPGYRQ